MPEHLRGTDCMTPATTPIFRDIVLVGGGHTHVGVLRMFAMKPLPGAQTL